MLEQASWRCHKNIEAADSVLLGLHVLAADEQTCGKRVLFTDGAQHLEDLQRELTRGRDHERAQPVHLGPFL